MNENEQGDNFPQNTFHNLETIQKKLSHVTAGSVCLERDLFHTLDKPGMFITGKAVVNVQNLKGQYQYHKW